MTDAPRCVVYPIHLVRDHPAADLQVALVGPHQVVVGRHYDEGTPVVFIPDGALVPDALADEMRVLGRLAGKRRNRVKARELLGIYSEGLVYGSRFFDVVEGEKRYDVARLWNPEWAEGQDVTEELGIMFKMD